MNYRIYYFTRTGNCERIAQKLAAGLSCPAHRIHDDADWGGFGAYFRFQAYAKGKKSLKAWSDADPGDAEELIVVSPVWGSRLPPSTAKFIEPLDRAKIHIVSSSKMDALRGREGFASVTQIIRAKKNEDEAVGSLLSKLLKTGSEP